MNPELRGASATERDLLALHGADWRLSRARLRYQRYAGHLQVLSDERPVCSAAHGYVRCPGDLSGGWRWPASCRAAWAPSTRSRSTTGGPEAAGLLAMALRAAWTAWRRTPWRRRASSTRRAAAFVRHRELFGELERDALDDGPTLVQAAAR